MNTKGIYAWWGKAYNERPEEWRDLVDVETSDKAYEEVVEDIGFGLATVKAQGDSITYDTDNQGNTTRFTHLAYAKGYMVSHEEMRDNLYAEVSKRRTTDLAFSMRQTKENVVAAMYSNGFSSSFTGADGVSWFNSAHPCVTGNQSNVLDAADISEAAVEDAAISVMNVQDSRGRFIGLNAESIIVTPNNFFEVTRILKSVLQNDTANNAVNALRVTGAFPQGAKVNRYLTSTAPWFVRTNVPKGRGATLFQRDPIDFAEDSVFDAKVQKYAAYERYSVKWADWRSAFGSNSP